MTADVDHPEPRRSLHLSPGLGWFAPLLVAALCLSLAWSLDDALLVLGRDEATDFLTWAALGGVLVGFIGPAVGWGRWTTHLIGAVSAALLLPLIVGWVLIPAGADPRALFQATSDDVYTAWSDLLVARRLSTFAVGHHLMVLGLIVWASSQFASYASFGHRRPLNSVIVIGLLLLANMSLTQRDQLLYIVVFSIAALFLLVRFHTLDEQGDWLRRRIGDPSAISGLYLRGGTAFIVVAVSGSLLLTSVAASAPLAGAWTDVGGRLIEWSRAIEPFLPSSGSGRSIGPSFGQNARIEGVWNTNDGPVFSMQIPATEEQAPYLVGAIYQTFDRTGWRRLDPAQVQRAPGEELLAGTADAVSPEGRRPLEVTISLAAPLRTVLMPAMPLSVNQQTGVMLIGGDGYFEGIERSTSDAPYTVTALIPATEADGGPTQAKLRQAGSDYPAEVMALYGPDTVSDDALGEASRALLSEIRTEAGPQATPYDLASATMKLLLDQSRFRYDTDVRDRQSNECRDLSTVECFARIRSGYCEFYATTMAVLLREMGVPTRYVRGYLPGEFDRDSGLWTARNEDGHSWVQVYFPGYGWIDFDPTGAVSELPALPPGKLDASPTPRASSSPRASRPAESGNPRGELDSVGNLGQTPTGSAGPLIAISILLALVVAAIAAVAWQRGPRGPVSADGTYGAVTRLAARLGFAPRPNQTVYEYAGALADVLPMVRPELETVAHAKVEVVYGGRVLGDDRMRALREAHRRLRVGLLRLLVQRVRGVRRGRRR